MIRYAFINNEILKLYSMLPTINFPINLQQIIYCIPNCQYLSYQQFAKINHCSVDEIISICESRFGCTYYDVAGDKYLILCNHSTDNNNNIGRQRWTCCHEIGHIICNHHSISACINSTSNPLTINNPEYEAEADYFAATLLAPFPLFRFLNINSALSVQNTFNVSSEAAFYRYRQYLRWIQSRIKTSWENDITRLYLQRNVQPF